MLKRVVDLIGNAVRVIKVFYRSRGKKLILIGSTTHRLTDNALGFALAAKTSKTFFPVFIGKHQSSDPVPKSVGIDVFEGGRVARWLWQKADVIAYTGYCSCDFGMPDSKAFRLQLWHGMPLKGIGYLAPGSEVPGDKPCDLAIATSKFTAQIIADSFRIPLERVAITGEPKTDSLPCTAPGWDWAQSLKKRYRHIIAYVPTWREKIVEEQGRSRHRGNSQSMTDLVEALFADEHLKSLLDSHNAAFVVRMHSLGGAKNLVFQPPFYRMEQAHGEAAHLLEQADIVVADYSSLIVDTLLFDKPLALWCEDYDEYTRLRPFPYFNVKETFGWAMHWSQADLVHWLADRLDGKPQQEAYIEGFSRCKALFHQYPRGQSGVRLLKALESALDNST